VTEHATLLLEVGGLLAALVLAALFARWSGQSPIPFFILLGLFIDPPEAAAEVVDFLATLGVSLLLFLIGLEFSPGRLVRGAGRLLGAGAVDFLLNFPLGVAAGRLFGLSWLGSAFLGGVVYISSSGIISRGVIENLRSANRETEPLLGLLVVEDLAVAVLLALLSSLAAGGAAIPAGALGLGKLALLVGVLFAAARLLRRPFLKILGSDSSEVLVLFLFALIVLAAGSAVRLGLSEAIGAFLVGMLVGETAYQRRVEETLLPFQQLFAAMFFIAFGTTIELADVPGSLLPALALLALFSLTKVATGFAVGRGWRLTSRARWRLGLSLTPRGEFSVLLAATAAETLTEGARLAPIAGTYVFLSALTGAVVLHHADRLAGTFAKLAVERPREPA
jgi:CPA2 family monovalent cation:H+ antiporter-2